MSKQKKRAANFTEAEKELLVDCALKYKEIIENKKTDAVTWSQKSDTWKKVAVLFNSENVGGIFREPEVLKAKYENMKSGIRKKSALIRAEALKTGGGPSNAPSLTPAEIKVKEVILLSVEGEPSIYDSDVLVDGHSEEFEIHGPVADVSDSPELDLGSSRALLNETIIISDNMIVEDAIATVEPPKIIASTSQDYISSSIRDQVQHFEWKKWSAQALKDKKHPALVTTNAATKRKGPFEALAEKKIKVLNEQTKSMDADALFQVEHRQKLLQVEDLRIKELELRIKFMDEKQKLELESLKLDIEIKKKNLL